MAESGSYGLGFRLDIKQILLEAQHRWLRPAEICEILRNYQKFHISPEAPNKPISGSIFLFDRKVLRYFRKDGHNWRKKKDGKTVKEAHEKLKVGSVDMLHCYYAHGEDNEHFQRRSYWLLEQDLMHIVFVHYLEVKGSKANIGSVRNSDTLVSNSENVSPLSSSFCGTSPTSTLSSGYEDAESEDSHQASSRLHSYPKLLMSGNSHSALSSSYNQLSCPGEIAYKQEPIQDNWQSPFEDNSLHSGSSNMNPSLISKLRQGNNQEPFYTSPSELKDLSDQTNFQVFPSDAQTRDTTHPNLDDIMTAIRNENYSFLKKPLISGLQTEESLKKVDSFSRWMAKELGEGDELNMQSSNGISWSTVGTEYDPNMTDELQVDADTLSPSVPRDQLFSIIDFSPNWSYSNWKTKILIAGIFLKSEEELSNCRWSIMFGELEVQAEILADGILCCHAPLHKPMRVPFYITCSNRLACSNIQEFEYRLGPDQITSVAVSGDSVIFMHLYQRFETILCMGHVGSPVSSAGNDYEKQNVVNKIISLMEEENNEVSSPMTSNNASQLIVIGHMVLEKQLKQNFYSWLLQRVSENGKGPTVVDDGGQSVLHLAAALGFNWALQPIIVSGVSIDFRDLNGWTALHWAAFYGREDTVAALVSLGAAPGALTDPSAEHPLGRTPADLASSSGHKGISGFLAESTLTTHLLKLEVHDQNDDSTAEVPGMKAIHTVSERLAVPTTGEDVPDTLSLKDSLAAVCNATQAAARIHQIFRIQSFRRKQLIEEDFDEFLIPDQFAVSLVKAKTSRLGHSDGMANSAALSIQKKFRGWKKRKEFLLIREKIVKIQAHVRGHQVRKKYKTVVWSVGIMEKIILRWRRKRSGLRGFRSDEVARGTITESSLPQQEDDYDFLKEGRKQSEERMEKALSRVKSMAQYPEARAQYRRLLTAAEGFRETKGTSSDMISGSYTDDMISGNIEDNIICPGDDLIDLEALFDDDTFMSLTFQ